jgi:hypothetical protein
MPAFLLFALLALLFAAPAAPLAAAGVPGSHFIHADVDARVSVSLTPAADSWTGEGFLPVRVRLENSASSRRAWTLTFRVNSEYNVNTVHSVPLVVDAGSVLETVVFVPGNRRPRDGHSAWVQANIEGPGFTFGGTQIVGRNGHGSFVVTAVSAAQETPLFAATNGAPGPNSAINVFEPASWPADWRSWSAFDRVVLTEAEFLRMDGARRAALRDWVAVGGVLDLYPEREGERLGGAAVERHGLGAIRRAARTLAAEEKVKPGYAQFHHGLSVASASAISVERRAELKLSSGRLGLSLFLAGFGLLVGPINLFVFAPAHRRHRLFLTVPALSLAASALMAGYIVVKDGFGGEGTRRGFVVLLPESNQALVAQTQISRTGVLLGGTFALGDDVLLAQGEAPGGTPGERSESYARAAGRAGAGWFASRRVQEHSMRQLVPTRARVELVGEEAGGAPVVQSSVGATLRDFLYVDARGRHWTAEALEPGRRVALREGGKATSQHGAPRAGSFVATAGAAEGIAPVETLASIRWDEDKFFYTGPLTGARTP